MAGPAIDPALLERIAAAQKAVAAAQEIAKTTGASLAQVQASIAAQAREAAKAAKAQADAEKAAAAAEAKAAADAARAAEAAAKAKVAAEKAAAAEAAKTKAQQAAAAARAARSEAAAQKAALAERAKAQEEEAAKQRQAAADAAAARKSQLDNVRQAAAAITSAGALARGALDGVAGKIRGLASAAGSGGEMSAVASAIGGVASKAKEAVSGAVDKLGDQLSKLGPEGEAAAAALKVSAAALGALLDIGAGVVGIFGALADVAIQVNGTLAITRDRFAALAGGAAAGAAVQKMLAGLNLPFAKAEVDAWAQSLLGAGIKGRQLEADIKAVAAATALMGQEGGAAAMTLFKRLGEGGPAAQTLLKEIQNGGRRADKALKEMGLSVADLGGKAALAKMNAEQLHDAIAKALAKKGAGPLADMALTFPVLIQRVKEGLFSLFDKLGPDVKKFMTEVKSLFAEFSKGGGAINGLKPVVTSVMQGFFSLATSIVKGVHAIVKFFETPRGAFVLKAILYVLGTIAVGLVGILALLATPIVILGAVFTFVAAVVGTVISAIVTLVGAIIYAAAWIGGQFIDVWNAIGPAISGALSSAWDAVSEWASGAASAAADFVAGLVGGIVSGAGAVADAVKGLASSALAAFTGALGIHSPSTIMLKHGEENIAGATAIGIDKGGDKVDAAMQGLSPKDLKSTAMGAKARGEAKILYIENLTVASEEQGTQFRAMLRREFGFEEMT